MRDWTKLDAFHMADNLALAVLTATKEMPTHQRYVLVNQLERAALSIPSNIVEGCARHSEAEYLRFLDIAYGSACELQYQLSVATRLSYLPNQRHEELRDQAQRVAKTLNKLIRSIRARPEA
jgi:four helix bundle protein